MMQGFTLPTWSAFWRRVRNNFRTIFTPGDLWTLVVTCLLLVIPVLALTVTLSISPEFLKQSGTWKVSLNQLLPVAVLSVAFGFLLARSHYSEAFSLILSAIYAVSSIGVIQYFSAPGNPLQRVVAIVSRTYKALSTSTETNTLDAYLLVLFLSVLIWFLGHNTAWHIFRLDRVWRAVLPPGLVLVLTSFYNTEQANLDFYLFSYVFLSLLLVIRSHIEAREFDWYLNRIAYQGNLRRLRTWFFRSGAIIGLIMLIFAFLAPTGSTEENAKRFQQFLSGDVMNKVSQLLNKLFGSLEGQNTVSVDYYGGDTLTLTQGPKLGDGIVMVVNAPRGPRYYWKSRAFDTYSNNAWTSPRSLEISSERPGLELKYPPTDPDTRTNVDQRFTMAIGTSGLVYAAPQPVTFGLPVRVEVDYVDQAAKTVNPGVIRQVNHLNEGESYNVTSSISTASATYLRALPANVPQWVQRLDLQLPTNITGRTRQLAQQIIQQANATTTYDKAKAIEQYLRANIKYNENLEEPPPNRELVDWLLFDRKEGFCTYYASAMVVMARSLGIPARMAAGFSMGVWDPVTNNFIVRERDAHTWVEVYFPQAGWVEFEPTSAQQTTDRADPNIQATATLPPQTTPTQMPSPTPTNTPTPTFTPTSAAGGAQQPPPPGQKTVTTTPSPTLTFTPTAPPTLIPTSTPLPPLIPPTVKSTISIALILSLIIAVLSFLAVGLLWWVEYRGLDRVSPIGRAYARMAIYARWLGIPMSEANTPLERGQRIAREVPEGDRPVSTITDVYINERYAPPRDSHNSEEDVAQQSWQSARRALIVKKIRRWLRRDRE